MVKNSGMKMVVIEPVDMIVRNGELPCDCRVVALVLEQWDAGIVMFSVTDLTVYPLSRDSGTEVKGADLLPFVRHEAEREVLLRLRDSFVK